MSKTKRTACKASRKDSQRLVTVKSEPRCEEENLWNTRADCQSFSESDIAYVLLVTKTEDLDLICHTQARPSKLQGFLFESAPPDGSEIWRAENTGIDSYQLRDLQTCPGLVNSLVKSEAAPPGHPDICPSEYNYMCNIETETEYTYGDENINNGPNSNVFMGSCDDRYVYQHVWNQPVVQLDRLSNLDGLLGVENSSTGTSIGEAADSGSEIWLSGNRPVEPKGLLAVRETKPKIVEVMTSNCEDWIQIAKNQPVVKLDRLCNTDILCHSKNSSSSMDMQNVALRQQNEQEDFGSLSQACTSQESVSESKKCTQIRVISKNGRKGYDLSEPGIVQSKGPLVVNADGCLDKYQYARYQPLVSLAKLPSSGSDNRSAIGKVGEKVSLVQQCLLVSDSESTRYQPLVSLVKLPSSCSDNRSAIGRVGEKVSVVQQCIPVSDSHELNTRSPKDVPAACNVQQGKSVGRDDHVGCYSARGEVCKRRHGGQGSDLARRDGRGVAHEHSCDSAKFQPVVRLRRSDVLLESDSNLTSSRVKIKPSRGTFANAKTKLSSRKSSQGFDVALADKVLSDDEDDDCVMMTTNTCDDMNQSPKHQSVVKLLRFPNVYTLQDKEESLKSVRVKKIQSFREQNFGAKNSNCCSSSGTCTVNVTETESSNSDTEHEYDGTLPNTVLVDDDCDDDVNNTCEDRYKSAKHQPIDRMQRSANVHALTDNEESLSLMRVIKIASAKERSLQRRHCDCVSKIGTPRVACTLNGKRVSSFRHADQKCGDPLSGTALSDHGDSDDAHGVVSSSSEERYGNAKYQPVVMLEKLSCVGENPFAMAFSRDACPKKVDCNGHVKLHSRENRLACTICEKIFRHSLHFRQRMIQHKGEKSLTFNIWDGTFTGSDDSRVQVVTQTAEKAYTCEESLKQAVKRMPTTRHPGKETYICETNKKTFRLSSVLERHTRRHSVKKVYNREKSCAPLSRQNRRLALQTIAKLHTCNVCQKGFIRHDHLKRHMSIHTGKTPCKGVVHEKDMTQLGAVSVHKRQNTTGRDYKHKISEDSCTQIDSFKGHEGEVLCHLKRHLRRQTVEKSQTCEPCGKVFQSRFDLSRHIRKHTGKMPFTCKVCAKSFDQPNVLIKHIRIHTVGEILCTSKTSRKGFKQPNHLRKHTSVHFADKPELHTCDICQKIFNHSGNLKRHLLIHTGEKPYTCKVCRRSFNDPCILKRHLIIHTGEKPYTCKVCKRSFNDHGNLRRHLIIHTGEKPYTCKVCQRSFNNRSNLRRHLIIHTKKPYTCKICSRGFNEPDKFERHTRVHTGKKNQTPVRSVGKDMRRHTLIHMGEKP